MGKKWRTGYPQNTSLTLCLIPDVKFMLYKDGQKLWEFHL
jgi:hypothetical protein